ncbi:MAG TPA: hypothetical protein VMY42_22880 [Thermoguttaceae bacterium]|nr:hypothetical protein [Thermoguttaceae bacterium]
MHAIRNVYQTLSAAALAVILMEAAVAAEHCCDQCGCKSGVRKICRPIVTTRRVEVTYWDSVCDEICLPKQVQCPDGGCGKCGRCGVGDDKCGEGGCGGVQGYNSCGADPCAGCCKVRTRNRLLRKTEFREVPVVYWVVEYVCDGCGDQGMGVPEAIPLPAEISIPPAPPLPEPPPIPVPAEDTAGVGVGGKVRPAGFFERKRLPIEEAIRAVWEAIP